MKNRIVILGGMGPQASLELHGRILRHASKLGAQDGSDYPEILHLSVPVSDFIKDGSAKQIAHRQLVGAVKSCYLWRKRQKCYCL